MIICYKQGFHDEEIVAEPEAQSPSQAFQPPVTMNKPWIFQRLSDLVGSSNPYYGSSLFDHKVKLEELFEKYFKLTRNSILSFQAAIEMVAKVKETLSKSAALKAEKDNEEKEDVLVRAKVEKLKKVYLFIDSFK